MAGVQLCSLSSHGASWISAQQVDVESLELSGPEGRLWSMMDHDHLAGPLVSWFAVDPLLLVVGLGRCVREISLFAALRVAGYFPSAP